MTTAFYRVGTISAQLNSKVVTGHGTSWTLGANKVISGDVLLYNNSKMYEVEHVISDTEIHLFTPFQDANITQQPYAILRNASLNISSRIAASVAIAINQKQQQLNEFNTFLTSTAPTVNMTDTTGNVIAVIPIPTLVKTINDLVNDASTITAVVQEGKTARDQAVAAKNASETALASVTTIKSEVTQLKTDVEGLKTDTETAKSSAASSASAAAGSVTAAAAEVAKAATEVSNAAAEVTKAKAEVQHAKDQVAIAAGHASASATSESNAGASATAAANSAQLAQAAIVPMRNEAEMWEMIRRNKDKYAASQFVDFGNHYYSATEGNGQNINEGLWARSKDAVSANSLFMNRQETATPSGSSKVPFALTTVAGFVSQLYGFNWHSQHVCNTILFPEAPDGTVIYDSAGDARGTGKANLDLLNEVDPKYGNAAKDHGGKNEAISRAFEGVVKNGDFRMDGDFWRRGDDWSFSDGIATQVVKWSASNLHQVDIPTGTDIWDLEVIARATGRVTLLSHIGASSPDLVELTNEFRAYKFKREARGSNGIYFRGRGNGKLEIKSITLKRPTEEAVITPHDVFGMELWLEEVTQAKPDVFDCGMVQSKATSSNGVATSASSRPQTYHAAFKGDTTTGHTSVNFFTATFEQQCKLAAKEENNLFRLNDGRIVQWRGRQLTFRGAGNGDWLNINPQQTNYAAYSTFARLTAQGFNDESAALQPNNAREYRTATGTSNSQPETGVFTVQSSGASQVGVGGLCFLQIWGEVPRFNDAAFHKTLNPMGTAAFAWRDSANGQVVWHSNVAAKPAISTLDCFIESTSGGSKTTNPDSGAISDSFNARDDGRKYDAIYPSGLGGVIDYRVSAHDMGSKEEAAKVFLKVVNGTYRGKEKLIKTRVFGGVVPQDKGTFPGYAQVRFPAGTIESSFPQYQKATDVKVGGHFVDASNNIFVISAISANSGGFDTVYFSTKLGSHSNNIDITGICYVIPIEELNSSVSGEFSMVGVIGAPAEILNTPALANGWVGGWIHVIPDGSTTLNYEYTRKLLGSNAIQVLGKDDRSSGWRDDTVGWNARFSTTTNSRPANLLPVTSLRVITYTAFAKQTKGSANKKVLNAYEGIGKVFAVNNFHTDNGVLFAESLTGKVNTANPVGFSRNILDMTNMWLLGDSGLLGYNAQYHPQEHVPISLVQDGNSPAVKALWSQASVNQQVTLQFNWNELVWDSDRTPVRFSGASSATFTQGRTYSCTDGRHAGRLFHCISSGSSTINGWVVDSDGNLVSETNATLHPNLRGISDITTIGWGDDSTIRIKDGIGTFINLNGDTCLYGTSELAIPYGYTKNQARAGSQVAGVDL